MLKTLIKIKYQHLMYLSANDINSYYTNIYTEIKHILKYFAKFLNLFYLSELTHFLMHNQIIISLNAQSNNYFIND